MTVTEESWDEAPAIAPAIERFEDAAPVAVTRSAALDAESYIIGCCILDEGVTLKAIVDLGLTTADFVDEGRRTIYAALRGLQERKAPIGLESLVEALGSRLSDAGGIINLMDLADPLKIGTTAKVGHYAGRMLQESANRRALARARDLIERSSRGEDVGEVEKAKKRAPLASKRVRIASAPSEPVTRLFLAGKPIATPGNLVTLISRAKTGKTATIGGAIAAIVAAHADRPDVDTLGFSAPHTKEAVVLIDTEQSPYDAFVCHQRALSRANEANDPDWLCHYALVGESAENLKDDLVEILAQAKAAHGGVFTIILDGVADFVQSVNDEAECNNFVTWLRSIAVNYDCPIICVIHSNEAQKSGDDGRGHLGKQLTRKAESNLLLRKEGDVTTITSEKQRKAPITESDNVAFRWSDQVGRHVSCASDKSSSDQSKGGRKPLYQLSKFIEFFPGPNDKHVPMPILWNKCRTIADIPRNTFRDLCEREFQTGELSRVIDKNTGPCYRLNPSPQ